MTGMRAITLHQPWASLVADERKPFETRSWPPPRKLVDERIAIHAGKTVDGGAERDFYGDLYSIARPHTWKTGSAGLPSGAVVATAVLKGAYRVGAAGEIGERFLVVPEGKMFGDGKTAVLGAPVSELIAATDCVVDGYGDYQPGRWVWWLTAVEALIPPVPARGHQGIWEWTRA